jgi:hypothetical protein
MDSDDEIAGAAAMLIRNVLEKSRKTERKKYLDRTSYGWKIGWSLERTYHALVTKLRTTDE